MAKAVCLWVMISDPPQSPHVLLARRAVYNEENEHQSFHNVWQPAVHGKVLPEESFEDAIRREMVEEGGQAFADCLAQRELRLLTAPLCNPDLASFLAILTAKEAATYKPCRAISQIERVSLDALPDFRVVDREKDKGGVQWKEWVMFDDHLETLRSLAALHQ